MLRKVTLALVAAASLSAMALAPSTASAGGVFWPKYPHHHHHWAHGHGFGIGFVGPRADALWLSLADRERLLLSEFSSFGSSSGRVTRPGLSVAAVVRKRPGSDPFPQSQEAAPRHR